MQNSCNLNLRTCSENLTPLHIAVHEGYSVIVEWLVGYGADLNAVSSDGNTVLHLAISRKNMKAPCTKTPKLQGVWKSRVWRVNLLWEDCKGIWKGMTWATESDGCPHTFLGLFLFLCRCWLHRIWQLRVQKWMLYHFSPKFYHLAMRKARSQLVLYVFHVRLSVYIYIGLCIPYSTAVVFKAHIWLVYFGHVT